MAAATKRRDFDPPPGKDDDAERWWWDEIGVLVEHEVWRLPHLADELQDRN